MQNRSKEIVIIDDSRTTLLLLENLIYDLDKHAIVHSFDKAQKGLQYLEKHKPDLIFLDIHMPKLGGLEILEKIKKSLATPIYIVSAESKVEIIERAFQLGADEYFRKPIDIKKLYEKMTQILIIKNTFIN